MLTTHEGIILSGEAVWREAILEHRQQLLCLEYNIQSDQALEYILVAQRLRRRLNHFLGVCLALRIEPYLHQKALQNMREGGKHKGSSNLTKAQSIDTRSEIAAAAGVSQGTVTKVKQIRDVAICEIQQAVRSGEISIHMAWKISRCSSRKEQLTQLEEIRTTKGTNLTSRRLIQKHVPKIPSAELFRPSLGDLLSPLVPTAPILLQRIAVAEIDAPGEVAYLSKGAMNTLRTLENSKCETNTC